MSTTRPQRLLRISKACDFCHKRRVKCQDNPADAGGRCRNCAEFDIPCTYARPSRRGRASPQPTRPSSSASASAPASAMVSGLDDDKPMPHRQPPAQQQQQLQLHHQSPGTPLLSPPGVRVTMSERTTSTSYGTDDGGHSSSERLSSTWQAFAHTSTPTLKRLVAVYHETVFPIFPFFDPIRLQRRLDQLEHVRNRAFFCSVMAACALASARARDGALSSSSNGPVSASPGSAVSGSSIDMPPEMFYAAAEEALPKDILQCRDFDYLRALALLSIASIQDAKIAVMQKYIGHYFTLMAINQWHDEANWSPGLHPTEIEERRRLYWSIYTLDVFTSIIWDGCIHFQESHAKVEYPTGRTDQSSGDSEPDSSSWMVGWNFTTDLYRILEHNLNKLRARSSKFNLLGETTTPGSFRVSSQDRVAELYAPLPPRFKHLQPATGDLAHDIFGFQAANIQATMALLEMVHLSLEVDVDLERKCSVVHNVLQTFHQVPKPYMRAISTPLIYHIGGIGVILGSVMEGPLSESAYRLVRDLLLSMAVLLESLEAFLHRSAGAGQRLRTLVARLEAYYVSMRNQNHENNNHVTSSTGPANAISGTLAVTPNTGQQQQQLLPPAGTQPQQQLPVHGYGSGSGSSLGSTTGPPGSASNGADVAAVMATVHQQQQQQQQHQQQQQQQHQHQHQLSAASIPGQQQPLSPAGAAAAAAAANAAAAASMFDPQQNSGGTPTIAGATTATGGAGGPASWVTAAGAPALTPDMNMQIQLPDEFLQDWTWPFAVSNSYLSF